MGGLIQADQECETLYRYGDLYWERCGCKRGSKHSGFASVNQSEDNVHTYENPMWDSLSLRMGSTPVEAQCGHTTVDDMQGVNIEASLSAYSYEPRFSVRKSADTSQEVLDV